MKSKAFQQLLITQLICAALLAAILLSAYAFVYSQFEERCLASSTEALERGLDSLADTTESFSRLVAQQRRLKEYTRISTLTHPFEPRQLLWLETARLRLTQSLSDMAMSNCVRDCVLVYQNGACISMARAYENISDYYGVFFGYDGMSGDEWRAMLQSCAQSGSVICPARDAWMNGRGAFPAITVIQSARYHYGNDVSNVAYLLLDAQAVMDMLVTEEAAPGSAVTISLNSEVLASRAGASAGEYRTVACESQRMPGLSVRVDIPLDIVRGQLRPLMTIFILSMCAYMLVGLALSLVFSYRNSRPIRSLTVSLSQRCGGAPQSNEYAFVAGEIDRMDGDLRRTRQELMLRESEMRGAAAERLMCGVAYGASEPDIAQALFPHLPARYCLCLARVLGAGACERLQAALNPLMRLLRECLCAEQEAHPVGDTLLFTLPICAGFDEPEMYVAPLEAVRGRAGAELGLELVIAVSDAFSGQESLLNACNQARQILRMLPKGVSRTARRADLPGRTAWVPVEYTDSQRFYEALMAGDGPGARRMIRNAFDAVRGISKGDQYIEHVFFTFSRVFERIRFELEGCGVSAPEPPEYSVTAGIDELAEELSARVDDALSGIARSRELSAHMRDAAVLEYIGAHIGDSELSARLVADRFSLPEREVQALIRRAGGAGFFEYVEKKRMARAQELILNTDMPLSDVATACGFALPNSFYKAFRRCFGAPPSSLRAARDAQSDAAPPDKGAAT